MSTMLVYDRRKYHGRYGIIKANTVCNTSEMSREYLTNLTGVIDYSFPFLKKGFAAVKISLVGDKSLVVFQ